MTAYTSVSELKFTILHLFVLSRQNVFRHFQAHRLIGVYTDLMKFVVWKKSQICDFTSTKQNFFFKVWSELKYLILISTFALFSEKEKYTILLIKSGLIYCSSECIWLLVYFHNSLSSSTISSDTMAAEFESIEKSLAKNLPPQELAEVTRILYGKQLRYEKFTWKMSFLP